ncbi:MAG: cytochrome c maturation protein CcmE [Rhodospirillaceae bacterium]|nr:cytochrome c maturation protein CcmE [Rhodospirillaceae bacterium]
MTSDSVGRVRTRRRKRQRLTAVLAGLTMLGVAAALVLNALEDSIVFFHSPTDIKEKSVPAGQRIRIGGLVEAGSWKKLESGAAHKFIVTDGNNKIVTSYRGILPDLFREGQGIVAEGTLQPNGTFIAAEVLAKHDENYMPREVADALKKSGHWKEKMAPQKPGSPEK